jgi:hypothetical protein
MLGSKLFLVNENILVLQFLVLTFKLGISDVIAPQQQQQQQQGSKNKEDMLHEVSVLQNDNDFLKKLDQYIN